MNDRDKVISRLQIIRTWAEVGKNYNGIQGEGCLRDTVDWIDDALEQIQAYQQILEWAVECDFGYDNIPEVYEQYKDKIEGMSYTDGLLYLASRSLEKGKSNV